jgi:hypothetical protein
VHIVIDNLRGVTNGMLRITCVIFLYMEQTFSQGGLVFRVVCLEFLNYGNKTYPVPMLVTLYIVDEY